MKCGLVERREMEKRKGIPCKRENFFKANAVWKTKLITGPPFFTCFKIASLVRSKTLGTPMNTVGFNSLRSSGMACVSWERKLTKYKIFENGRGREKDSKEMRERYLPHGRIQYARLCVRMRAWWCVQKCAREGDTRDDVCRGEYRKLELFLRAPRPNSRA